MKRRICQPQTRSPPRNKVKLSSSTIILQRSSIAVAYPVLYHVITHVVLLKRVRPEMLIPLQRRMQTIENCVTVPLVNFKYGVSEAK
jgi:hypothetical protein